MRLAGLTALPLLVVLAAGCGSKSGKNELVHTRKGQAAVVQTINLLADSGGKLKFDKSGLKSQAGTIQLVLTNPSSVPHNIAIRGNGLNTKGKIVRSGGRSSVTATLKPGTYEFYCSVDGHARAGMKGKLVVGKTV